MFGRLTYLCPLACVSMFSINAVNYCLHYFVPWLPERSAGALSRVDTKKNKSPTRPDAPNSQNWDWRGHPNNSLLDFDHHARFQGSFTIWKSTLCDAATRFRNPFMNRPFSTKQPDSGALSLFANRHVSTNNRDPETHSLSGDRSQSSKTRFWGRFN